MRTLTGDSLADQRFIMTLLAITACMALAMSVAGIYDFVYHIAPRAGNRRSNGGPAEGGLSFWYFAKGSSPPRST
jgi:hypothetical protein